jgi:hypothetical protein
MSQMKSEYQWVYNRIEQDMTAKNGGYTLKNNHFIYDANLTNPSQNTVMVKAFINDLVNDTHQFHYSCPEDLNFTYPYDATPKIQKIYAKALSLIENNQIALESFIFELQHNGVITQTFFDYALHYGLTFSLDTSETVRVLQILTSFNQTTPFFLIT